MDFGWCRTNENTQIGAGWAQQTWVRGRSYVNDPTSWRRGKGDASASKPISRAAGIWEAYSKVATPSHNFVKLGFKLLIASPAVKVI